MEIRCLNDRLDIAFPMKNQDRLYLAMTLNHRALRSFQNMVYGTVFSKAPADMPRTSLFFCLFN